ncbi:hypothetical protein [Paraburkholderia atlantica]|uniref:hypothetical protein n=1 Tax=Paraburkholderia atlantica TaxID=2654982 RepID=UPI00160E79AE|nr:hypothetical protein [Paraburkholderia atlantica]MBB5414093.1 hypothetical protein [Paraburkholderia atlantica]
MPRASKRNESPAIDAAEKQKANIEPKLVGRTVLLRHRQFGNGQKVVPAIVLSQATELDGSLSVDVMAFAFGSVPQSLAQIPLHDSEKDAPSAWLA